MYVGIVIFLLLWNFWQPTAYIEHHLRLAAAPEGIFTPNALSAIYQVSVGVARIINALAIKTLTIGALEKRDSLTEEEVYRTSKEL